ncbi:hypothetical protein GF385_01035 [Candidatus Dependentiae bacterium]|nr:hypothetical protein [Candidatus Dependentiae bacterium]
MKIFKKILLILLITSPIKLYTYNEKDLKEFFYGTFISMRNKNLSTYRYGSLRSRRFQNRRFIRCKFSLANFENFNFKNTNFENCNFFGANFISMNFLNTYLYNSNMSNTKFSNCSFKGSWFILCQDLTEEQKLEITRNGGFVIDQIIKVKSQEEWNELDAYLRRTLPAKQFDRILIQIVEPRFKRTRQVLSFIKNKLFELLNKAHEASTEKLINKIREIYSH